MPFEFSSDDLRGYFHPQGFECYPLLTRQYLNPVRVYYESKSALVWPRQYHVFGTGLEQKLTRKAANPKRLKDGTLKRHSHPFSIPERGSKAVSSSEVR